MKNSILYFIVLFLFSGCAQFKWKKNFHKVYNTPYIFSENHEPGSGLKPIRSGYIEKSCFKDYKTARRGGEFQIKIFRANDRVKDYQLQKFISDNLKRIDKYNLIKGKTFTLVFQVENLNNQKTTLDESLRLKEKFLKLIRDDKLLEFYHQCGTSYVKTIKYDSIARFFVTFYNRNDYITARINQLLKDGVFYSGDIARLNLLGDLIANSNTYCFLEINSHSAPIELEKFILKKITLQQFLQQITTGVLNSDSGHVTDFLTSSYSDIDQVRKAMSSNNKNRSIYFKTNPSIFSSLNLLTYSSSDFILKNHLIKRKKKSSLCDKKVRELAKVITEKNLHRCKKRILSGNYSNIFNVDDCKKILKAVDDYNSLQCINKRIDKKTLRDYYLADKIFLPGTIKDYSTGSGRNLTSEYREYLFSDKEQFEFVPVEVSPGDTFDLNGKVFSNKCIDKKSIKLLESRGAKDFYISSNFFPHSVEKYPWWKRIIFFWRSPGADKILLRSSYEIKGMSKKLDPDFLITSEAMDMAKKDISRFFKEYGTHYVSQIKYRRGIVSYFYAGMESDFVKLSPYGVSKNMLNHPLFKIESMKDFLKNKEAIINIVKNEKKGIPVELELMPWAEYLIDKKIVEYEAIIKNI